MIEDLITGFIEQSSALQWSHYQLHFQAQSDGDWVPYLGSALRGVFGHGFKDAVCLVEHRECSRCLLKTRCPYPYIFETQRPEKAELMTRYDTIPHPFVLLPPPPVNGSNPKVSAGQELSFGFRLFGPTRSLLPYFILAWEQMGQMGLGVQRIPIQLLTVDYIGAEQTISLYQPGQALHPDWESLYETPGITQVSDSRSIRLELETPLRLSQDGKFLNENLPFDKLISSILRRVSMLAYFHQGLTLEGDYRAITQAAKEIQPLEQSLNFHDFQRWSNRQHKKMNLGGLMGSIQYGPDAVPFLPLLELGQQVLIGKGTSFGLGRYRIL